MTDCYPIPQRIHRVTETIKKSRFIVTVAPADTAAVAKRFVDDVKTEFADATHNCWAFVIGAPGSTARIGMSDDGEPHGTAGRPILNVLLHGGIGDIVAVVTRYFGGVKLGTGGLVRAYSGVVQQGLASLPVVEKFIGTEIIIEVGYAQLSIIKQVAETYGAHIVKETYQDKVSITLALPEAHTTSFIDAVKGRTANRVVIDRQ